MELGGVFLLFRAFFFLRERECELWTTFYAVLLIEEWWKTFLLMMPARQSQLLTIKVLFCFVCYVFECRRLEVKRRGIQSSWTNTTTTIFLPHPIVCSCFSRALTAKRMEVCILH